MPTIKHDEQDNPEPHGYREAFLYLTPVFEQFPEPYNQPSAEEIDAILTRLWQQEATSEYSLDILRSCYAAHVLWEQLADQARKWCTPIQFAMLLKPEVASLAGGDPQRAIRHVEEDMAYRIGYPVFQFARIFSLSHADPAIQLLGASFASMILEGRNTRLKGTNSREIPQVRYGITAFQEAVKQLKGTLAVGATGLSQYFQRSEHRQTAVDAGRKILFYCANKPNAVYGNEVKEAFVQLSQGHCIEAVNGMKALAASGSTAGGNLP